MNEIQRIERRLQDGAKVFTAKEVAHLLNAIRIYKALIYKLKEKK